MLSPRFSLRWLAFSLLVAYLGGAPTALARPWKVGGRVLNGEFAGLEGDRVSIRLPSGKIRVVRTATQLAGGNNPYAQLMFVRGLSRRY